MIRVATLLCVLACAYGTALPPVPRFALNGEELIVGGSPIDIKEAPYQVSFQRMSSHMCGGSIVSQYHVLTAAHCSVVEKNVKYLVIGSGSDNLRAIQKHRVVRNVYHSRYNTYNTDFDVAVLKVDTPFTANSNRAPISIVAVGQEPDDNEPVRVTGWGATKSGGSVTTKLMAVDINMINRQACERAYREAGSDAITSRMICAGRMSGGKDSCQGDSGGPLISTKTGLQVGVVSWGYGCAVPNYPGVYTNLANKDIHDFVVAQTQN